MAYDVWERLRLNLRDVYFGVRRAAPGLGAEVEAARVLCNSYPKSGTHLLAQILTQFPSVQQWDDIVSVQSLSGVMNSAQHIEWKIGSAPPGSLVRAHLMHVPEVLEVLEKFSLRRLFVYRDLRDVAVSHANWVLKEPRIFLHDIYKGLPGFDACLMASIVGTPIGTPFGSNLSQPDIGTDFRRWQGWLGDPDTLALRFEDLVGERGCGDEALRIARVLEIAGVLGEELDEDDARARFGSAAMDPSASHTFRKGNKGAIGTWRETFKPQHVAAFKRVAGDLLIELGYEQGHDW